MKRILVILGCVLLLAGGLGYLFRAQLWDAFSAAITADMFVTADTDAFDPGLPIGSEFPAIRALYQGQELQDIDRFVEGRGVVLVANRSADWCPYCMAQYIELQQHLQAFRDAGIGVVALTYDAPALQQAFVDKHAIGYPFLSDIDATSVRALGILNEDYAPGDSTYGIPHPGIIVVDPRGRIAGKLFVDGYEKRIDGRSALAYAQSVLE